MPQDIEDLAQVGIRRKVLRSVLLLAMAGAVPRGVAAQSAGAPGGSIRQEEKEEGQPVPLPQYPDDVMRPVNLHEFESVAKAKLARPAYDYVAAGAADELTLRANLAALASTGSAVAS